MRRAFHPVILLLLCAESAFAQGRGFVGGSVIASVQGSEAPTGSVSLPRSGVGGFSIGGNAEIGIDVTPRFGVLAEVTAPVPFEAQQLNSRLSGNYQQTAATTTNHTDIVFSGLVGWNTRITERTDMSLVFGPSLVREYSTSQTSISFLPVGGVPAPPLPDSVGRVMDVSRWTLGLTTGVSVAFKVRSKLECVPLVRAHWIDRETNLSFPTGSAAVLGLAPVVFRFGIGLRVRF